MDKLPIGALVSIVPKGNYSIGPYYKMISGTTEIFIDPDKHTLEGPWEIVKYSKKRTPNRACLKWNNSKFITHVRHDWLESLIQC